MMGNMNPMINNMGGYGMNQMKMGKMEWIWLDLGLIKWKWEEMKWIWVNLEWIQW